MNKNVLKFHKIIFYVFGGAYIFFIIKNIKHMEYFCIHSRYNVLLNSISIQYKKCFWKLV